jgi:hypothetical protein
MAGIEKITAEAKGVREGGNGPGFGLKADSLVAEKSPTFSIAIM